MKVRRQNGLTLIGFFIVLIIGLFFAYAGMRVIPMYLEYHALINAMDSLQNDPLASKLSPNQIKTKITTSLWASYASDNIKHEHILISRKVGGVTVRVKYEVRKPFMGNIDLVGSFDRSVVLR